MIESYIHIYNSNSKWVMNSCDRVRCSVWFARADFVTLVDPSDVMIGETVRSLSSRVPEEISQKDHIPWHVEPVIDYVGCKNAKDFSRKYKCYCAFRKDNEIRIDAMALGKNRSYIGSGEFEVLQVNDIRSIGMWLQSHAR